ncbi:MAG: metal ABC transporter substrate-binding protein [Acidimicrobiia bacterium]|nr:metal ABC transporter substrate-binding protein [Acidimicrobiia bacterium]
MRSRTTKRLQLPAIAVGLVIALLVTACGDEGEASGTGLTVVATTTVMGDLATNVLGDAGEVIVLMPIGADPHDFRASSAQVADINRADLVLANGLGLEEGLEDVLDGAAADGVEVVEVGPLLDPLPFSDDDHEGDDHGTEDPHVWFDLARMADASRLLAAELERIDPSVDWAARGEDYATRLLTADADISSILSIIPDEQRKLVTSHGSLGYFANRYDFEVVGTVIPSGSTVASPSSEELASLVDVMRREDVTVVFGETTQPQALADAVAAELGSDAQVVSLFTGSLGGPGSSAETLIDMARLNATSIAEALGR